MLPRRAMLASWLLRTVVTRRDVDIIVGDLEEEYASRSNATARNRWYWGQVTRSMPLLFWEPVRQGGYVSAFAIGTAACAVQAAIELVVGVVAYELRSVDSPWSAVVAATVIVVSLAALGYGSARLHRGAGTAFALVAALAVASELLLAAMTGRGISTGALAALFLAPAMALAGGQIAEQTRNRYDTAARRNF